MPAPTYQRAIRRPWLLTDEHEWTQRYGTAGAVCGHCGAGLGRVVVIDTDGGEWGVDCWRRVTGHAAPRRDVEPPAPPVLRHVARAGARVWHDGVDRLYPADGVPPEVVAALTPSDRARLARVHRR